MNPLRDRLSRLRAESGGPGTPEPAAAPQPPSPDLRRHIERLGGARRTPPGYARERVPEDALAELLGGRRLDDGVVLVEEHLPTGSTHGDRRLGHGLVEASARFGGDPGAGPEEIVFMDTETTGLAGGTGTVVFLLGIGRFSAAGLHLQQFFLAGFRGEEALLEAARHALADATTLVSYNGRSFDHPLLATRYRLAGLRDPFADLAHVDLLHPTRRAFRRRWRDCRLRTAEERLTGFTRSDDLPGSEAPETWFAWVRRGVTRNLPRVLAHNRNDVVSLAALLPALHECFEDPAARNADVLALARHAARRGDERGAYDNLLAAREVLEDEALLELARLARRRSEWEVALGIWRMFAAIDHVEALERLAKYHEHVARDPQAALACARRLVILEPRNEAHRHRERRLLRSGAGTNS